MIKSVYIHIPFCIQICSYCAFSKVYKNDELITKYLYALEKEIKKKYNNEVIETIYIGGGTPSCLNIKDLQKLFDIIKQFQTKNLEFTIECNVEDINEDKLMLFKKNNVNRISIGVQTFDKENLKKLNRNNQINIQNKIALVQQYFNNINIDLIYGFHTSTLKKDLEMIKKLKVNHISTYSLMIEPHTQLFNKHYGPVNQDRDYSFYQSICTELKNQGFIHYETSNFAKKGYESKHNLTYWNNNEYYGFGVSASGYINNIRYTNTKSLDYYIKNEYSVFQEKITSKIKKEYEFILGLRKIKGINKEIYFKKYKEDIHNLIVQKLLKNNKLQENESSIFINPKYIYVANEILMEFVDENVIK